MSAHIIVEDLVKNFGDTEAVRGVSFSVQKGEVLGILGRNGAGKTTTLECIEGLLKPTSGTSHVFGLDSQTNRRRIKERIGVQLQASAYFDYLNLKEILELFGRFYSHRLSPDVLLSKVDLVDKANFRVNQLSGGQQQRFAIAATLVNDPELIFLDEPTTGLDPLARHNLWEFIKLVHGEGRTVVLTTHYMEEAQYLCDRVAIMDQGLIAVLDTPTNLVRSLKNPYEIVIDSLGFVDDPATLERLESIGEVGIVSNGQIRIKSTDVGRALQALFAWVSVNGIELSHLQVVQATLEDVFLAYTGKGLKED